MSVNVAIPGTPDQAPDSAALRVQVEMLDPASAAAGTDTTPAGADDVALRVRLALSDAKVEDPVFTQAPARDRRRQQHRQRLGAARRERQGRRRPSSRSRRRLAGSGDGGRPAADTAAPAEVVVPVTTGEGTPASSTQTVPLPVTDQTPPAGGATGDKPTPIVLQVESATEPPAEPPAAPQPSEEEPAKKPDPAAEPQPTAPHDDDADDDDDCKHDRDHAAKSDASAGTDATAAADAAKATAQQSDDDDD